MTLLPRAPYSSPVKGPIGEGRCDIMTDEFRILLRCPPLMDCRNPDETLQRLLELPPPAELLYQAADVGGCMVFE